MADPKTPIIMPNDIAKLRRLMRTANYIKSERPNADLSFSLKKAWWYESLRDLLSCGLARFTYRKMDGTIRVALGTRCPSLIPKGKMPKGDMSDGAAITESNIKAFPYFDLDRNEWRSFGVLNFINLDNSWLFNEPRS